MALEASNWRQEKVVDEKALENFGNDVAELAEKGDVLKIELLAKQMNVSDQELSEALGSAIDELRKKSEKFSLTGPFVGVPVMGLAAGFAIAGKPEVAAGIVAASLVGITGIEGLSERVKKLEEAKRYIDSR
jgi:hypothetical protein